MQTSVPLDYITLYTSISLMKHDETRLNWSMTSLPAIYARSSNSMSKLAVGARRLRLCNPGIYYPLQHARRGRRFVQQNLVVMPQTSTKTSSDLQAFALRLLRGTLDTLVKE